MRVLYFDTETTNLRPEGFLQDGRVYLGQICQLAYLMEEDGVLTARNYYFDVQAIERGAAAVNGLSVPLVHRLSEGHVFADHVDSILADFDAADRIVAHNLAFDERFMSAECQRLGLRFVTGPRGYCTMRAFTPIMQLPGRNTRFKFPSLEEFARYEDVTQQDIMAMMHNLYGVEKEAHDARHDTVKMYLALDHACRGDMALAAEFGKI